MSNFRFATSSAPNVSKQRHGITGERNITPYSGSAEPKVDKYAAQYLTQRPWLQTADGALGPQPNIDLRPEESALMAHSKVNRQNRTLQRGGGLVSNDGTPFFACVLV